MAWNLFGEQPLLLDHPALRDCSDSLVSVAGVSKLKQGILWWSADYIISCNMPGGMPGSGFAEHPLEDAKLHFDQANDAWIATCEHDTNEPRTYIFTRPTPEYLQTRNWEEYTQYLPSLDELHKQAQG